MKTYRFYLALAFLVAALLTTSATLAGRSCAQESPQAIATPRPPALWVLNEGYGAYGYTPDISVFPASKLKRRTGTIGAFGIKTSAIAVGAMTFDSNHDLWLGLCLQYGGALLEFTPGGLRHLVTYGSAKPSVVIQDPLASPHHNPEYLECPQALRFDPLGNLWVAPANIYFAAQDPLLEYSSSQLLSSGTPVPAAVIETPFSAEYYERIVLAFDHAGNLWQSSGPIFEYTAAQLAAGIQTDPNQTLTVGGNFPELQNPSSLTFDTGGNLWVRMNDGGTNGSGGLEMYAAADLNGSGTVTPTPAITLTSSLYGAKNLLSSFDGPRGLAFDNLGDLWVGNRLQPRNGLGSGSMVEFSASQLTTSGSPLPVRAILSNHLETNLNSPVYMTFGPALP
jgi:hypothetical protein